MLPTAPNNCPINECTADGRACGRCWHYCENGNCPRHGNVQVELNHYRKTGRLTLETKRKMADRKSRWREDAKDELNEARDELDAVIHSLTYAPRLRKKERDELFDRLERAQAKVRGVMTTLES